MGATQAAETLLTVKQAALRAAGEPALDDAAAEAFKAPVREGFEAQADPIYATAGGGVPRHYVLVTSPPILLKIQREES